MEGIECVLLDIEGTILEIAFVKDVLFPYALKALPAVLASKWGDAEFKPYKEAFPESAQESPESFQEHVEDLTKRDVKIAYLKNLQGYLWQTGYEEGAYTTSLFPDVVPKLKEWKAAGLNVAIYSSGSVFAQKLLFGHVKVADPATGEKRARDEDDHQNVAPPTKKLAKSSEVGDTSEPLQDFSSEAEGKTSSSVRIDVEDLQYLISDWFDTTNAGPKTETKSYETIANNLKSQTGKILFLSDNVKEVDAAIEAGMHSLVLDRPGNNPLFEADRERLKVVTSLDEVNGELVQHPKVPAEGAECSAET